MYERIYHNHLLSTFAVLLRWQIGDEGEQQITYKLRHSAMLYLEILTRYSINGP